MRLSVLMDNNTFIDQYFMGEPAVSYFIEADGKNFLFDVAYSDAFLTNAERLRVDLYHLNAVVLSHGHLDHTWGLPHLVKYFAANAQPGKNFEKPALIAHPSAFTSRRTKSRPEIGPNTMPDKLSEWFDLKLSSSPVSLTEKLMFLGEIPRVTGFEADKPLGKVISSEGESPDFLFDDSALVYRTHEGLVIITGCSHSGICNIVEYAMKVTGETRVLDIIGGLHLLNPSKNRLKKTLDYLKKLNPTIMHACHCTDLLSKVALANVVKIGEVGSGLVLNY